MVILGTFFCFFQCFFGHLNKLLLKNEEILKNKGGKGKVRPRNKWTANFLSGGKKTIFLFFIYPCWHCTSGFMLDQAKNRLI